MLLSKSPAFLQKKLFWAILVGCGLAGSITTIKYFTTVFPVISIEISMNRDQALTQAHKITKEHEWNLENYHVATSFDTDSNVQTYAELECGGINTFTKMIEQDLYQPYIWHVRYFKEYNSYEAHVAFTPRGILYGFELKIPESQKFPSISQHEARKTAHLEAEELGIDFSLYEEIEASENTLPNGRIDHTFVYKLKDVTLGTDGQYRLTCTVSGNKVSAIKRYVQIPELFTKKFEEMRSANNTLSTFMQILFFILYIIGGCFLGGFLLIRSHRLITQPTYLIALVLALLGVAQKINIFPIIFIHYDTTASLSLYYLQYGFGILMSFIAIFSMNLTVLSIAEGLDRWAFENHLQFLKIGTRRILGSFLNFQHTCIAYASLGIFFGLVTGLYYFLIHVCSWWAPADMLVDPSIVATYFPILSPLAGALQAGILEEALCRAIPLAGAMLLGRYFKKENFFLILGLIIQALVFAGLHVNYAQLPAYFRLVEIFLPALFFGILYLIFGLYPVIIIHVLYDLILMGMTIFTSDASGMLIQKILLFSMCLIPFIISIYHILRTQSFTKPTSDDYNNAWKPIKKTEEIVTKVFKEVQATTSKTIHNIWLVIGLVAVGSTLYFATHITNPHSTLTLSEKDARFYADEVMKKLHEDTKTWTIYAYPFANNPQEMGAETYVWQTAGEKKFQELLGSYITDTNWHIRYARFEGNPEERMEEYHIFIDSHGSLIRVNHIIPETKPGSTLKTHTARGIALKALENLFGLTPYELKEISVIEIDRPQRKDFIFTFQDITTNLNNSEDQARIIISIAGDEVIDYTRSIFTPETWVRQETLRMTLFSLFKNIFFFLLFVLILIGYGSLLYSTIHTFNFRSLFLWLFPMIVLMILQDIFNSYPLHTFALSTAQPFYPQLFTSIASVSFFRLLYSGLCVLFISQLGKTIHIKTSTISYSKALQYGLIGGSLFTACLFGTILYSPSYKPLLANYLGLIYISGLFCSISSRFILFLIFSISGISLIEGALRIQKKYLRYAFSLLAFISSSILLTYLLGGESIFMSCIGALCTTFCMSLYFYTLAPKSSIIAIPGAAFFVFCLCIREWSLNAYIMTSCYALCSGISILIFALWWFTSLMITHQKK